MTIVTEAIFEDGVLKPTKPLPLNESEKVTVTVEPHISWADRTAGMLKWTRDFDELRRVVEDDEFGIRESR